MSQFVCSFPLVKAPPPEAEKPVAWGVSPRNRDLQLGKPRTGRQNGICRTFGALNGVGIVNPVAYATGYVRMPLWGFIGIFAYVYVQTNLWPR